MSKGAVEQHYASTGTSTRVLTALRTVHGQDVRSAGLVMVVIPRSALFLAG